MIDRQRPGHIVHQIVELQAADLGAEGVGSPDAWQSGHTICSIPVIGRFDSSNRSIDMKTAFAALAMALFAFPNPSNAQAVITYPSYYYPSGPTYYTGAYYVPATIVQQSYAPSVVYPSPGLVTSSYYLSPVYYSFPAYYSYPTTYSYPYESNYYSGYRIRRWR